MGTYLIFLVVGIAVGSIVGLLWGRGKIAAERHAAELARVEAEAAGVRAATAAEARASALAAEKQTLEARLADDRAAHARELAQRDELARAAERQAEERSRQFQQQLDMAREQLKTATADLLATRTAELNKANTRDIDIILQPLRQHIKEMKEAMDASRELNTRNTASLQQAIADIMERTAGIGAEADKLARALRHENKTQGNWGEVILSELLDSQGLKRGINYEVQSTIVGKDGKPVLNEQTDKRMIPDVILHYADNRDLIVDAKVSLSAYIDYTSTESEKERDDALRRHVKSLRDHVKELARKDYKKYVLPPRQSLDYMIMFVPNEAALQLAMSADPPLWREALQSGVFIAGECNLTAALRIIHLAWRHEVQAQNQRKVFEEATTLLERVGDFYKKFQEIGSLIDRTKMAYTDTANKLINGRQSLMVPARRLRDMGAREKSTAQLPELTTDALLDEND